MAHYYDEHPNTKSHPFTFDVIYKSVKYTFHSDHGVFAKDGLDFASRLLVEAVDVQDGDACLDLGCGTGVMGLLIQTQSDIALTASDINERAVALTKKNAAQLNLQAQVVQSDGFKALKSQYFNHIFMNPPIRAGKKIVYALLEDALNHLQEAGTVWVVIHKKHGADSLIKHFAAQSHVEEVMRKKGFRVLKMKPQSR